MALLIGNGMIRANDEKMDNEISRRKGSPRPARIATAKLAAKIAASASSAEPPAVGRGHAPHKVKAWYHKPLRQNGQGHRRPAAKFAMPATRDLIAKS